MKTSDIGLKFNEKLLHSDWASFQFVDGMPTALWFGTVPTSIGDITVVGAADDLCYLGFEEKRSLEKCLKCFPQTQLTMDQNAAKKMVTKIMDIWEGKSSDSLRVIVNGTNFQKDVWNALMKIPNGHAVSYGTIAEYIGRPNAVRAVGTAVGSNPISLFIPCHRVVQKTGKVENYLWGDVLKQKILMAEASMAF